MKTLEDITIRTEFRPGDIGHITARHGELYNLEYGYGVEFESYVAGGLFEFYHQYDKGKDSLWIAEDKEGIVGFALVKGREDSAQFRFFYIEPEYRGVGLGKKMWGLAMDFIKDHGFKRAYLLTTSELHRAAQLYTSSGFTLTDEKPSTAFGKAVVEQRYDLEL